MRKTLLLLLFTLFSFSAIHADVEWKLSDDGTLTISGKGDMHMPDYGKYEYDSNLGIDVFIIRLPWRRVKEKIKKIVIEDGVTNIGAAAFDGCSNVVSVAIPNSVTGIGMYAFEECI